MALRFVSAKESLTEGRIRIFLKRLEAVIPPRPTVHHVISFEQYGSDKDGWEDRLALHLRLPDRYHTLFLHDGDILGGEATIQRIVQLIALKG